MDMYIVDSFQHTTDAIPECAWTLEGAQKIICRRYPQGDLQFEQDRPHSWMAYDWSRVDDDGNADRIPERIMLGKISSSSVQGPTGHPSFDDTVIMEMRIMTRSGVTSMRDAQQASIWDSVTLGRGVIIESFATRAGRALADYFTKGDPR